MLREMIAQSKENQNPDQPSSQSKGEVSEGKSEEDFQTIEHHEANDDSEFETEEEEDDGEGHGQGGSVVPTGSMFENILRAHGIPGHMGGSRQSEAKARDALHPYTQVLSLSNLDDCVELENASFPEEERGSREKFLYRLSKCPELSFGVFSRPTLSSGSDKTSHPSKLVAHIFATRTISSNVTDASIALPSDWQSKVRNAGDADETTEGHQDQGRTVAVHSLAVLPEHRNKQIGSMLMKAYIERIKSSKIADRISLLAHGDLIAFYEKIGFKNLGASKAQFGGGNWTDMVLEFDNSASDADD